MYFGRCKCRRDAPASIRAGGRWRSKQALGATHAWPTPVGRVARAHNPEVADSSPPPATEKARRRGFSLTVTGVAIPSASVSARVAGIMRRRPTYRSAIAVSTPSGVVPSLCSPGEHDDLPLPPTTPPVALKVFYPGWWMETMPLTRDLLSWLARTPRTYRETIEVWQTSCPRLSIWEDAIGDGLVRVRGGRVELTESGETLIRRDRAR
jgi:hypothetical protein